MSNTTTMFDYKGEIFSGRELLAIEVGREIEQERIIKLIYEYMDDWESQEEHMEEVIALIKGEK